MVYWKVMNKLQMDLFFLQQNPFLCVGKSALRSELNCWSDIAGDDDENICDDKECQ